MNGFAVLLFGVKCLIKLNGESYANFPPFSARVGKLAALMLLLRGGGLENSITIPSFCLN